MFLQDVNLRSVIFLEVFFYLILATTTPSVWAKDRTIPDQTPSKCNPYNNYTCLDSYLGEDFFTRLFRYYKLEIGHATAPSDPHAPSSHRVGWPATPQSTPPMPFTEWPYGATTTLGVSLPNAVDSPFMVGIANTSTGKWLQKNHIQAYGWVNGGGNISTNTVKPGGNAPMAYMYTPNTVQLDQAVLYIERVPNTVQTSHIDWGFRLSGIYGENYRYTTAYGIASYQLLNNNSVYGYDFPMVYGELYIPNVAQGLLFRVGRYISIPDIEAQLAPNNYLYSHSMTYTFDNYTNEGLVASLAVAKNVIFQLGLVGGTDTAIWNIGKKVKNPAPNPLYPDSTFLKDPGARVSAVACARITWNDGKDTFYPCMDGINNGVWGYNNLQWYGFTFYHKFNDRWHIAYELYTLHQHKVANINNPIAAAAIAAGGTPFSPEYIPFNAPNAAQCNNTNALTCTASVLATVAYINYQFSPLDNISLRPEFYDDKQGQRTGVKTRYLNFGLGWQHWLSPQIELRPEIDYDYALDRNAFNGNVNAGIPPSKRYTVLGAMDIIAHF
ncbi:porin [Legionella sp. PATHC035]|uniref:outer membrane beta-barrel protein n=1 Tax=Legionella sp. PATHC035 TaxID=2992040 RepID=UPI002244856D|nr:outer membrane beta-barrel protein [Legionella sp. PATHC035]MCW8409659.1 porin [Legionella sp. PATHC035]